MTEANSLFRFRDDWRTPNRARHIFVDYKPQFTLESLFDYLDWCLDKDEDARLKLKQVLYGFGSDRKVEGQSQTAIGTHILDLFYRLALLENFKDIVSQNYMVPTLWYVRTYQEFQTGLFQRSIQSLEYEQAIIDQINHITVPDVNSLDKYKDKDGRYDLASLNHDCLYNAITLAVCARNMQLLSEQYRPKWEEIYDEEVDKVVISIKYERSISIEEKTIVALGKAETLYGMCMGFRASGYHDSLNRYINRGNEKK